MSEEIEEASRSHWLLAKLVEGNIGISIVWATCNLLHFILWVESFNMKLLLFLLVAFGAELLRFLCGLSINLCSSNPIYWMIFIFMPCIQLPAMVCLRWSLGPEGAWMHMLWNTEFLMIFLQSVVSLVYHLRCRK